MLGFGPVAGIALAAMDAFVTMPWRGAHRVNLATREVSPAPARRLVFLQDGVIRVTASPSLRRRQLTPGRLRFDMRTNSGLLELVDLI